VAYLLSQRIAFPDPELADPGGLLAVGGDLSVERLALAYRQGIFPWYNDENPILWWSPDPRPLFFPRTLHLASRFQRYLRSHPFSVSVDQDFQAVISACATVERPGQAGTWLVSDMVRSYFRLHQAGYAHSVECRLHGRLVGGIYGVAVGRAFFGESMFHYESQASKVAFTHLAWLLQDLKFHFMDCQQATPHVVRFGAREIPRREFLQRLDAATAQEVKPERWSTPSWWADGEARKQRIGEKR